MPTAYHPLLGKMCQITSLRGKVEEWYGMSKIKHRHDDLEISIGRTQGPMIVSPSGTKLAPEVAVFQIKTRLGPGQVKNLTWEMNRFFAMHYDPQAKCEKWDTLTHG